MTDISTWLDRERNDADALIRAFLDAAPPVEARHSRLAEAVRYALTVGGKRLRPILVRESAAACGAPPAAAKDAAIAIEFIHTFSLIHDDLPAMDDDDLRRGKPTVHKVYGEALAILAGDWLLAQAFSLLARSPSGAEMAAALSLATLQMIAGQAADIEGERQAPDVERVKFIHSHKTAALMESACVLGAVAAEASTENRQALANYGRHVGVAFQIVDDLLDVNGVAQTLGKAAGKDAAVEKQTYPAIFGVAESQKLAENEISAAIVAVSRFGDRAGRLAELARFVIARDR